MIVIVILVTIVCAACKCSKKNTKEEEMEVDENRVYGIYELDEKFERQYSTHEIVDQNNYYE